MEKLNKFLKISKRKGMKQVENYHVLDVVEFTKDIQKHGISKGQQGAILEVYNENDYEIEVLNDKGEQVFLGTVTKENFKLIK